MKKADARAEEEASKAFDKMQEEYQNTEDRKKIHHLQGECIGRPFGCGKRFQAKVDKLTFLEYNISNLCPDCQDKIFTEED